MGNKGPMRRILHVGAIVASSALAAIPMLGMASPQGRPASTVRRPAVSAARTSAACPGGVVTITEEDYYGVPSKTDTAGTGITQFLKNYEKTHSCVRIKREHPVVTSDAQYLTHVLSQFSTGSQPDLLMLDNPQLDEFAADKLLVPLTSLGKLGVVKQMNYANVVETKYKRKLYALSAYMNGMAIFYNKTLLKKAGITTLPKTWAQFSADAKKFAHGPDYGFVFSAAPGPGAATWQLDPWTWTNGGTNQDPSGKPFVQALSYLTSFVKDGAAPKSVVNWMQATQVIQEFEAGKAAFCEDGLWEIPSMLTNYPKLKWGVIPFPTPKAGQTVISPLGGEVWAIPKTNTRAEKAAFSILKAMAQNPVSLAKAIGDVPSETRYWTTPPWNTSVYRVFFNELKTARARTHGFKNPANEAQVDIDISNGIAAALVGKQSPAAAMKAVQAQINPLLK